MLAPIAGFPASQYTAAALCDRAPQASHRQVPPLRAGEQTRSLSRSSQAPFLSGAPRPDAEAVDHQPDQLLPHGTALPAPAAPPTRSAAQLGAAAAAAQTPSSCGAGVGLHPGRRALLCRARGARASRVRGSRERSPDLCLLPWPLAYTTLAACRLDLPVYGYEFRVDLCVDAYWYADVLLNFVTGAHDGAPVAPGVGLAGTRCGQCAVREQTPDRPQPLRSGCGTRMTTP